MSGKIVQFRKSPTRLDEAMNDLQSLVDDVGCEKKVRGIAVVLLVEDDDVPALTLWHALAGEHDALVGSLAVLQHRILDWMER